MPRKTIRELEIELNDLRVELQNMKQLVLQLQRQLDRGPDPRLFGDERGTRY